MLAKIKKAALNELDGGRTNLEIDVVLPNEAAQTIQVYDTVDGLKIRFEFENPKSIEGRKCKVEEFPKWMFVKYLP